MHVLGSKQCRQYFYKITDFKEKELYLFNYIQYIVINGIISIWMDYNLIHT